MNEETDKCEACGKHLVSIDGGTGTKSMQCMYCKQVFDAKIYCPAGHYVCDACHARGTTEVMKAYLFSTAETDPFVMADTLLKHPAFKMYGPEHHVLVPAVVVTAAKNAGCKKPGGQPITDADIDECIARSGKIPGGWCGFYGACGAAIGAGVATSILTRATPSTSRTRTLANRATSKALGLVADDIEHCCKRATKLAITVAVETLKEALGCTLDFKPGPCPFSSENTKCQRVACPFFGETPRT